MAVVSSGKQRKALVEKVSNSLARRTANLDYSEKAKRYKKTKTALQAKFALGKIGIQDAEKRQRIQRLMQKIVDRENAIHETGRLKGNFSDIGRLPRDPFIEQCQYRLVEELGSKRNATIFLAKMFFTRVKLRPKK